MGRTHRTCCSVCVSTFSEGASDDIYDDDPIVRDIIDRRRVQAFQLDSEWDYASASETLYAGTMRKFIGGLFTYTPTGLLADLAPSQSEAIAWADGEVGGDSDFSTANLVSFSSVPNLHFWYAQAWKWSLSVGTSQYEAMSAQFGNPSVDYFRLQLRPVFPVPSTGGYQVTYNIDRESASGQILGPRSSPSHILGTVSTTATPVELLSSIYHHPSYSGPADPCCQGFGRPSAEMPPPSAPMMTGPDPAEHVGMGAAQNLRGCCG